MRIHIVGLVGCALALACCGKPQTSSDEHHVQQQAPAPTATPTPAGQKPSTAVNREPPQLLPAPAAADVADVVTEQVRKAQPRGRKVVVYVGADWCAPCKAFREQLLAGAFDDLLAGTLFIEFDADIDRDRLTAAGYHSRLIPLLALPNSDGTCSAKRTEGARKGPDMASQIAHRLANLLSTANN